MAGPSRFQGIPDIIYGTAFKFENSASLVEAALLAGFRAIDTAGKPIRVPGGSCRGGNRGSIGLWFLYYQAQRAIRKNSFLTFVVLHEDFVTEDGLTGVRDVRHD